MAKLKPIPLTAYLLTKKPEHLGKGYLSIQKPKQVKVYRCPKCEGIIEFSYEKAVKHVNTRIGEPLPVGLTFLARGFISVIISKGKISDITYLKSDNSCRLDHGYVQDAEVYSGRRDAGFLHDSYENSKVVAKKFKEGKTRFLTPSEFENFQKDIYAGKTKLIRTCPSLEKLVASTKK